MTLRTLLISSASMLGLLGLLAAAALVWTTTLLSGATSLLGEAIESVRAAQELERTLLIHDRDIEELAASGGLEPTAAPHGRRQAVVRWLERVRQHISSEEERALVARVAQECEAYLAAANHERRLDLLHVALASAEELSQLNVSQARAARQRAERVDAWATLGGAGAAASLLAGIVLIVAVARSSVFRPLLALRDAIAAYKQGHRELRAPVVGPEEVREVAAEFNDMAAILAAQQSAQLRFIAGVAHDLKNPLHTLQLSASLIAQREELPADGKGRQLLDRIARQAGRLNRMVEDLLDRTRIEAGALDLRLERCDLRELAAEVVDLHRSTVEAHTIELSVPDEPVIVECDPSRMSQVLTNLLNNAIKYSPKGGRVELRLAADRRRASISVSDEGVGIPAEDLERIFEPFKRSPSTRADIPGVGLGLSVSRRITRAHGGEIRVESIVGRGTTFRVDLPLSAHGALEATGATAS